MSRRRWTGPGRTVAGRVSMPAPPRRLGRRTKAALQVWPSAATVRYRILPHSARMPGSRARSGYRTATDPLRAGRLPQWGSHLDSSMLKSNHPRRQWCWARSSTAESGLTPSESMAPTAGPSRSLQRLDPHLARRRRSHRSALQGRRVSRRPGPVSRTRPVPGSPGNRSAGGAGAACGGGASLGRPWIQGADRMLKRPEWDRRMSDFRESMVTDRPCQAGGRYFLDLCERGRSRVTVRTGARSPGLVTGRTEEPPDGPYAAEGGRAFRPDSLRSGPTRVRPVARPTTDGSDGMGCGDRQRVKDLLSAAKWQ